MSSSLPRTAAEMSGTGQEEKEATADQLKRSKLAKIMKRDWKEQKRGDYRKKKSFAEECVDLGCTWRNAEVEQEEQEKAILEEARARNEPLPPARYPRIDWPFYDDDPEALEKEFYKSLSKPFRSWIIQAEEGRGWIKFGDLPLALRFAMRRPLMPEATMQSILGSMGLNAEIGMDNIPTPRTWPFPYPSGKNRELIRGIDVDHSISHVSSKLKRSPCRAGGSKGIREGVTGSDAVKKAEEDEAEREIDKRQRLWKLYENIQQGHIDLKEAPSLYQDLLELYDVDNDILVMALEQFGIPTEQIPSNGRVPSRGPPRHDPFGTCKSTISERLKRDVFNDEQSGANIGEITNIVNMFRSNVFTIAHAVKAIEECLAGLTSYSEDIEDILTDYARDPTEAALLIWGDACDNTEDEDEDENECQKQKYAYASGFKRLTPNEPVQEHERPTWTGLTDGRVTLRARHTVEDDATRTMGPTMSPPAVPHSKPEYMSHENPTERSPCGPPPSDFIGQGRPTTIKKRPPNHDAEARNIRADTPMLVLNSSVATSSETRDQRLRTPMPDPTSAASTGPAYDPHIFVKTTWDGSVSSLERYPSPEDGVTDDLCGLLMSTKKARELGHAMGLSADYLKSKVRTGSIQRELKKCSLARSSVVLQSSKRKASSRIRSQSPAKLRKLATDYTFFAMPGETQEEFTRSHFDSAASTPSRAPCAECLRQPCLCVDDSNSPHDPKGCCPKCKRVSCTCKQGGQSSKDDRSDQPDVKLPSSSAKAILGGRTRLFKAPNMVLAYLSRVYGNENMYDQIIEAGKHPPTIATIHSAHRMLTGIGQAIRSGGIKGLRGVKDKEAITVLRRIRDSLKTLQESDQSPVKDMRSAHDLANRVSAGKTLSTQYQHPKSVIAHLARFTNNATIATQLREWGCRQVTDVVYERVKLMFDYVIRGVQHGKIQILSHDDEVVMSVMQHIVQNYQAKENLAPKGSIKQSGRTENTEPNPMLAYLSRVMEHDDPLNLLMHIEGQPRSNATNRNIGLISNHVKRGIASGEFRDGPLQGEKDAKAQAILVRLQGAAKPLQAWVNSRSVPERPRTHALGSGDPNNKDAHGQTLRNSSPPIVPERPEIERLRSSSPNGEDGHEQNLRSSPQSPVENIEAKAESKEQWWETHKAWRASRPPPGSIDRALPTSPYMLSQPISPYKRDHATSFVIGKHLLDPDCVSCLNNFPSSNLVKASCKHLFCCSCFELFISACLESTNSFPASCCDESIALNIIADKVSPELFAQYHKRYEDMDDEQAQSLGLPSYRGQANSPSLPSPAQTRSVSREDAQIDQISSIFDNRKGFEDEHKPGGGIAGRKSTKDIQADFVGSMTRQETQSHVGARNTLTTSPRPESEELPKPRKTRSTSQELVQPVKPVAKSDRKASAFENLPRLPPGKEELAKTHHKDAFDQAQGPELRRQTPFSLLGVERCAVRAQRAQKIIKDQEANSNWELPSFFSNSNASSTATSSAAASKLFDKYRGIIIALRINSKRH